MSSYSVKVLNSSLKKKLKTENQEDEEEEEEEEEDNNVEEDEETDINDGASDTSEHYVLEYYKDKVLSVVKKNDNETSTSTSTVNKSKKEQKNEENDEYQSMEVEEEDDDTKSVQEVFEHVCGKCYKSFSSFQNFKTHSMYCKNDGEIAKNIITMMKNLKTIEQESIELEKQNICFCCKESWETAHSGHIRCPKCPKSFKNSPGFERHLCLIHSDCQTHKCSTCNAQCPSLLILGLHEKAHQRGKPFACKKCGEEFTRKYHLNRHHMYSGCEVENVNKKVVLCKVCGKEFYRLDNLRMHLKQHLGQDLKSKDYQCPYCEKAFYGTATLNIHIRTHTGERPFTCDLCGSTFPSNPALRKHRRTHTGERPYQCSQCVRAFAAKEVLNRHMKTHTGEKPHACTLCDKRFIQATQLKQHLITHEKRAAAIALKNKNTTSQLYKCRKCKLVFNTKDSLNKHRKESHNEAEEDGSILCVHCKRTFQTEGGLKRHITRIHVQKVDSMITNDKLSEEELDDEDMDNEIICNICNETFDNKKNLEFHRLKVHDNYESEEIEIQIENHEDYEENNQEKLNEECICRFCNRKFTNNAKFIKHMEDDHGAVVLSVDNNQKNEVIKTESTQQIQLSIKEETGEENIEIVDVVQEITSTAVINDINNEKDIEEKIIEMEFDEEKASEIEIITANFDNDIENDNDKNDDNDKYVLLNLSNSIVEKNRNSPSPLSINEQSLTENIIKLLDLLIDKDILLKFGYPNSPIEDVLLKVIKNCGHNPKKYDEPYDYTTKLREYVKLLFTVVVDNDSIKELLNNHPVDKVICQVLEMAEKNT